MNQCFFTSSPTRNTPAIYKVQEERRKHWTARFDTVKSATLSRSSTPYLYSCMNKPVNKSARYDFDSLASEILRAEGEHPFLPALNKQYGEDARKRWRELKRQQEGFR